MALIVTLAEYGNPGTAGKDKITLKAETESPLQIARSPIIIPLPGGSIVGLDLGRNNASLSISGVVDYELTELFVDGLGGTGSFVVGETITGTSLTTTPTRTTPTAKVVAGIPNLTSPTSLIVNTVTDFFVDNETVSGATRTATVNCPFPTKRRLEHVARYWYASGQLTLTTRSNSYVGYIAGMEFNMAAGYEDRYTFRIAFAEATQGLT
jgi:hypothetical protein